MYTLGPQVHYEVHRRKYVQKAQKHSNKSLVKERSSTHSHRSKETEQTKEHHLPIRKQRLKAAFNFPKTILDHLTAHVLRGKYSFWMECSRIVLILFMLLTGTYGRIQVYTEIQTRRNPYENWTLHRLNSHSSTHTPKYPGLTNNSALSARAFVPLLDDPQASRRQITRRVPFGEENNWNSVDRISHVWTDYPKVLRQRQNRWRNARLSSLPPWYVNQYKRYPRDQPDPTHDGITRVPWNYQSKCRSCGRPLLQDSFCSDDFVIRAYVYKELNPSVGSSQFLMYIYEVYRPSSTILAEDLPT
ncbi:unnamed protein product [Calicophoron daubneyi]|uniref:Uncharacterized protein n=1 Tax=Calicophoron daubneyi TaxID=300641 RepID=A0AAV2T8Q8_CALDB